MSAILKMPRFLILIMLVSFATISAVLFTPGIPDLTREFGLSTANIQWVMSIFLAGYCIGQLPYGPVANRLGRKKTIYIGLAVAFVGCAIVYLSEDFVVLCIGRFIQALGSAVGLKVTFTMISDVHAGHEATKAIGYVTVAFAIMQGVGVAVGGFIVTSFGWRGCFAFLLLYTVILFLLALTLPETSKHLDLEALHVKRLACGYARQFKDSFLVLHGLLMGLAMAVIYIFSTEAPTIAIRVMGVAPAQYGLFSLIPALGMGVGFVGAARLAGKMTPRIAMLSGILVILIGVLIMALSFSKQWVDGWSLFLPSFLIFLGSCFPWVFASSVGMSEATDKSNASAVIQFINIGIAFAGTLVVGISARDTPFTIPLAFGIIAFLMLIVWLFLRAHHRRSGHA